MVCNCDCVYWCCVLGLIVRLLCLIVQLACLVLLGDLLSFLFVRFGCFVCGDCSAFGLLILV